jgi:hypothetical protein
VFTSRSRRHTLAITGWPQRHRLWRTQNSPSFGFVVESVGTDARFVRDVLYFMATHKEKFRSARVAIIVTMALRSGVKTAFTEMLAEFPNLPMPIKIFRTYRDADRWLSKGD